MKQIVKNLKTVSREKILHVCLLVLFSAVIIYSFYLGTGGNVKVSTSQNSTNNITRNYHEQENLDFMVFSVYSKIHTAGLKAFNDPELMVFYENDLQQNCPFYKPDGVSYRDCVLTLEEKEKTRLLVKNSSAIAATEKY